ncbi:cupin domain-containing protein [Mesorhizobium sp. M1233]|uniref:cupin domain-containing protein n=1 Tax=Mesorhizobium sp. M1233 TaxID=2957072 RepID=UPI0033356126
MSRCGDVYENKVTGEYAVILRGTEDRGQGPGIAHLTARPGAAVVGEHFHPNLTERFTVLRGRLDACIAGSTLSLGPGQSATVEAGVAHDWWNSSKTEEAHVLVEVDRAPGADNVDPNRFELLIGMLFGLANAGKVDRKGRPSPLQAAGHRQGICRRDRLHAPATFDSASGAGDPGATRPSARLSRDRPGLLQAARACHAGS